MMGYLVVYDGGDQLFDDAADALRFAHFMEAMGHMTELYEAFVGEDGTVRHKWQRPEALRKAARYEI